MLVVMLLLLQTSAMARAENQNLDVPLSSVQ